MRNLWSEVAPFVKARAVERDTSNRAIANALGVDQAHVSRLLAGKVTPSWQVFVKLCEILDVSADALLNADVTSSRLALAFEKRVTVEVAEVGPGCYVLRFPEKEAP